MKRTVPNLHLSGVGAEQRSVMERNAQFHCAPAGPHDVVPISAGWRRDGFQSPRFRDANSLRDRRLHKTEVCASHACAGQLGRFVVTGNWDCPGSSDGAVEVTAICSADMLPNVRGFPFHAPSASVTERDLTRRVAVPKPRAADIGKHVRATTLACAAFLSWVRFMEAGWRRGGVLGNQHPYRDRPGRRAHRPSWVADVHCNVCATRRWRDTIQPR
jgi:hypothetical protein